MLRAIGYAGLGFYDRATLIVLAVALPFMWVGGRVAGRIEPHVFARIVGGVLLTSGAALLFR